MYVNVQQSACNTARNKYLWNKGSSKNCGKKKKKKKEKRIMIPDHKKMKLTFGNQLDRLIIEVWGLNFCFPDLAFYIL